MSFVDPRQTAGFLLGLRGRGIHNVALLRALERMPRAAFVPPEFAHLAQRDIALPLPCGQTMHEPLLAAQIVEALDVAAHHKVLEIGTGSGFVSALLSVLADEVTTLERYATLVKQARQRFAALALRNIRLRHADAFAPLNEAGRYDRILVHALIEDVPDSLAAALAPGGSIVAAKELHGSGSVRVGSALAHVGGAQSNRWLMRFSRGGLGRFTARTLFACHLQPLVPELAQHL